ncbi:MAG: hypothetical protein EZS28_002233 [Streblomastix strix]|uniref:Uncharacterized protein n=1 Tax=Streblomastix strix TaxID=222440 RepID=A0A5J4X4X8_9EUKA|nr:MAG: hypothetical protein EZS28_002233 [Streblomastix strix]
MVLQKLNGTETTLAVDTDTKIGDRYAALTINNLITQQNCVIPHIVEGITTGEQEGQLTYYIGMRITLIPLLTFLKNFLKM